MANKPVKLTKIKWPNLTKLKKAKKTILTDINTMNEINLLFN